LRSSDSSTLALHTHGKPDNENEAVRKPICFVFHAVLG
jgi:hypothetical protein